MTTAKRIVTTVAGILLAASIVCAQEPNTANTNRSGMTVAAVAAADRVRFTAPSSVVQMRLEVYAASGEKVFDNEIRGGNVIDWHLQDGQAQRLSDGSYLCVVTAKSLSGRLSQKLGSVTLTNAAASLRPADTAHLTSRQSQAVGPLEENASLMVLDGDEPQTGTAIAHDGTDGQVIRGRGALSFRIGDLFSGSDLEQMRLTPEGNLGIGISHPSVRLEVDGLIRTSQGIVFPDGTIQYSAASKTFGARSSMADQSSAAASSPIGSPASTAKGVRNDKGGIHPLTAGVYDVNAVGGSYNINAARVGIGTASPLARLHVGAGSAPPITGGAALIVEDGASSSMAIKSSTTSAEMFFYQDQTNGIFGTATAQPLIIRTNNQNRIWIDTAGKMGIGTATPQSALDVGGAINTSTQYTIGGNRVLSIDGLRNVFAGVLAGQANTTSADNAFFGYAAGAANTSGHANSFFGEGAGVKNVVGFENSFFGFQAGSSNLAQRNSFFGAYAGQLGTKGEDNSFFGWQAGVNHTTGNENSFFGSRAGKLDTAGQYNSFFGYGAGSASTANSNSFFGASAGSDVTSGGGNSFFGAGAGGHSTLGNSNSFVGVQAGNFNSSGSINSYFGHTAGLSNTTGSRNTLIGGGADVLTNNLTNASAIGANAAVNQSNSLVLGSINGVNQATADTKVGIGTTTPTERLTVKTATSNYGFVHTNGAITVGSYVGGSTGGGWYGTKSNHPLSFFVNNGAPSLTINTNGIVSITTLGLGGSTALCRNPAGNVIAACSSSLRYKTAVQPFSGGLDVVNRLRPISFTWKEGGMRDIGLGAEEVEKVAPMLTFRNDNGEVEGVKYNQLSAVFINAFKEQQEQIKRQQEELGALRRVVCRSHPRAQACKK